MTSTFIKKGILSNVFLITLSTSEESSRVLIKRLLPLWDPWLLLLPFSGLDKCTEPSISDKIISTQPNVAW